MGNKKKFITEDTKVNIDEFVFKIRAEELICELFVDYVNNLNQSQILELKNS